MSTPQAKRLQGELSSLLVAHYAQLPMGLLYQVCADAVGRRGKTMAAIPVGPPRSSDDHVVLEHLRAMLDGLLYHRFPDVSDRDANAAISASLQHVDRSKRASGSVPVVPIAPATMPPNAFVRQPSTKSTTVANAPAPHDSSASFARVPSQSFDRNPSSRTGSGESRRSTASSRAIPTLTNSRGGERTNTRHNTLASRGSSADTQTGTGASPALARHTGASVAVVAPPPPTRTATWVRSATTDFGLLWSADQQTADLEVEDSAALDRLALEMQEAGALKLPLDPPPRDASAVLLRVGIRGETLHSVRSAANVGASVTLMIPELPEPLRIAARRAVTDRANASQTGTHRVAISTQPDATPTAFLEAPSSSTTHRVVPRSPSASELVANAQSEEELIDARRRRAQERRAGASASARKVATDQLRALAATRTPTAGSPAVTGPEEAADRIARRRASAAARRVERGEAPTQPSAEPLPHTSTAAHEAAPSPQHASDFDERRRSSTRHVVASAPRPDLQGRRGSSTTHKTVPAAPPVDELRDRSARARSSAGFSAVDSWARTPTPSSVRKRILSATPDFGSSLGVEESASEFSSPAAVLLRAAAKWPSALVQVATIAGEWSLLVREDQVLDIQQQPEDAAFELYHLIAESGLASASALATAEREAEAHARSLLEQLVADGALRYREVEAVRTARLRLMLDSLLHDPSDYWRAEGYQSIGLSDAPPIIFARRAWEHHVAEISARPIGEVEAELDAFGSDRPRFVSQARLTLNSLGLEGRERRLVVELLTGEHTCAQLLTQSPLRPPATRAIILALQKIGLLDWDSIDVAARRVARSYADVEARLEMLGGDPFELLESHWSCDDKLLRDALHRLQRMLDLDYIAEHGTPAQSATAKAVSAALDAAWRSLSTHEQRAAVRRKQVPSGEMSAARELYRKKAEIAVMRDDVTTGEDAFRRMIELDPSDDQAREQLRSLLSR